MTEKAHKMVESFKKALKRQIKDHHYSHLNPETARHELYGYLCAMREIGLITDDECIVMPSTFGVEIPELIDISLPDGRTLVAYEKMDEEFPGIKIELHAPDKQDVMIAMVEYNTCRRDYTPEQRLRILSWNTHTDEAAVNMSYDTGEFEKD